MISGNIVMMGEGKEHMYVIKRSSVHKLMLPVTDLSRFAAKNSNSSCQLQPIYDCKTVFILLQYTPR